jgi:undecaprenyl-diphosphatase
VTRLAGLVVKSDVTLYYLFNRKLHCLLLDIIMRGITQLGSTGFTIVFAAALLFSGKHQLVNIGTDLTSVLIVSQIIVQSIKRVINRPRPYRMLKNTIALNPPACKYSFPSGHTCAAFAIAFAQVQSFPAFTVPLFFLAALVGISRIYLGFHYPTDVLVGILIAYFAWVVHTNIILTYLL